MAGAGTAGLFGALCASCLRPTLSLQSPPTLLTAFTPRSAERHAGQAARLGAGCGHGRSPGRTPGLRPARLAAGSRSSTASAAAARGPVTARRRSTGSHFKADGDRLTMLCAHPSLCRTGGVHCLPHVCMSSPLAGSVFVGCDRTVLSGSALATSSCGHVRERRGERCPGGHAESLRRRTSVRASCGGRQGRSVLVHDSRAQSIFGWPGPSMRQHHCALGSYDTSLDAEASTSEGGRGILAQGQVQSRTASASLRQAGLQQPPTQSRPCQPP